MFSYSEVPDQMLSHFYFDKFLINFYSFTYNFLSLESIFSESCP